MAARQRRLVGRPVPGHNRHFGRGQPPLEPFTLGGGLCAVLRHQGPYATMRAAYQWLYGQWLVQSGFEAADSPVFKEYLNNPRDTPPAQLLSDIYLPLVYVTAAVAGSGALASRVIKALDFKCTRSFTVAP